jgi:hypothetical protein
MRAQFPYFVLPARPGGAVKAAAAIVLASGLWASAAMANVTIGGACSGGAAGAQSTDGNNAVCISSLWQYPAYQFGNTSASCNTTNAGIVKYTSTHTYFCNGASWTQLYEVSATPAITASSGNGYLVMSKGTWNGNLGGQAGADAKCLTDITTNTGWMGYSTANSNGQLVADKVHALICTSGPCNNLIPLTTYYFADANDAAVGGGSFTTDAFGAGPGDSNSWAAANYFGGTYQWWSGHEYTSATQWATGFGYSYDCNAWTSSSTSDYVSYGHTSMTQQFRWRITGANACNEIFHLICYVDP